MPVNMDAMKARLEALQNKGKGGDDTKNIFWRPESDVDQTIRLVTPASGDPFCDLWFHYDVGGEPGFLSPKKNYGEDDPLDSFVRTLWREYNETKNEEVKRVAKKLSARQRFYAPVVIRGEEDKGVRIWGFGKRVYETLLGLLMNPEYGDITDPMEGTDLVINYSKPAGASFPETKVTPRRKSSKLMPKAEDARELLDNVPDFDQVFNYARRTPQQVQEILDKYLAGDSSESSASELETTESSDSAPTGVDAAFQELVGS